MPANIPILDAVFFHKEFVTGRTKPCVFECESKDSDANGEYVVKLHSRIESGKMGLGFELLASQLALFLDLTTPQPAVIHLDPQLAEIIPDNELSTSIKKSAGPNFGSKVITGGYETWPTGKPVPGNLKLTAAEIFAFDALIQNPDRRAEKPNVLWKGDELYIIDHEMGFSFCFAIGPLPKPWRASGLGFLRRHLFYHELKGREINLDRFAGVLETLSVSDLNQMASNLPMEWQDQAFDKIKEHLHEVTNHVNDFIDEIKGVLT